MWANLKDFWEGLKICVEGIGCDFRDTFASWFAAGYTVAYVVLALVIALIVAVPAYADDRVMLHTVSEHSNDGRYVERNWGIGVELQAGSRSVCDQHVAGALRNSHDNPALYATCSWTLGNAGPLQWHGQAGLIAGYTGLDDSWTDAGILPLVGVNTRIDVPGPVDPDVLVVPTHVRGKNGNTELGGVALLSLTMRF